MSGKGCPFITRCSGKIHLNNNSIVGDMKKTLIIVSVLFASLFSFAQVSQDRAKMERERQAIQKELGEIQSVYNQVKGQKKETIGQLNLLQKKMSLQNRYISNINKEIKIITDDIYLSNLEINRLRRQLDTLKTQYSRSVVYAYKNRSNYDYLNFIFSASTFNDALKRISYLKSYRAYRQQQVSNIIETQELIEKRKAQLLGKKTQKDDALQNQTKQMKVLEDQKNEKDAVVNKLKSRENDLAKQIAARKKRDAQLKGAILAVIKRELEIARKKAEEERKAREAAEKERLAREKEARDKAAREKAARDKAAREKVAATKDTKEEVSVAKKESPGVASSPEPEEEPKTVSKPVEKPASRTLNEHEFALNSSFQNNRGKLPWPVDNGYVSIPFGTSRVGGLSMDNPGITIATSSSGVPVKAIFDGEVSSVANLGDGMTVMIRHGKYFTVYSNLASAAVSKGMTIKTGQVIGRSGVADDGHGGQIDFLLMVETKNVNPEPWLR